MFAGPRVVRRRPLLRAAVVGGTAYAAGRRSAAAQSAEDYQDQRLSSLENQQSAPPQQASAEPSMMDQLGQLNTLHQQGALTDDEFAAAKAKLLGQLAVAREGRPGATRAGAGLAVLACAGWTTVTPAAHPAAPGARSTARPGA